MPRLSGGLPALQHACLDGPGATESGPGDFSAECQIGLGAVFVSAYALGGLQAVFSAFSPVEEDEEEEGGAVGANRVLSVGELTYFQTVRFVFRLH